MCSVSTNVYAKFSCALLRIKKALEIFGPGRTDNNNKNRVAFWDPPFGTKNVCCLFCSYTKRLLWSQFSDWSSLHWTACIRRAASHLIGLCYGCWSFITKQQAFWLVWLSYNSSSDWFMLQMPINDDKATSLLIGLSLESKKEHIVRAVLESLAFRFMLLYETVLSETKTRLSSLVR